MALLIGDEQQWLSVNGTIEPIWSDVDMLNGYVSIWQEFKEQRDGTARGREWRGFAEGRRRGVGRRRRAAQEVAQGARPWPWHLGEW